MLKEINWQLKVLNQIKVLRHLKTNHNRKSFYQQNSTKLILRVKLQTEEKSSGMRV